MSRWNESLHPRDSRGRWVSIASVGWNRTTARAANDELDAQGFDQRHPIRGVIGHGSHTATARDAKGNIIGAIGYSVERGQKLATIRQMRVLSAAQGEGVGRQLIKHIADELGSLPNGHRYTLRVVGALDNRKGFYAATGAEFPNPFSSFGTWSPETLAALRRGEKPRGTVAREHGESPEDTHRRRHG